MNASSAMVTPGGSREPAAAPPLTRFEAQWFAWICAALFPEPPRGPYPVAITSLEPARFYARLCAEARFDHHLTLRAALWVVALVAPVVVLGRLRTFGGLTVEEREAVLLGMVRSPHYLLWQLAFLMKAQAGQVYCSHEGVRRRLTESHHRPRAASVEGLVTLRRSAEATSIATSIATSTTSTDSAEHPHDRDEHAA